MSVDPPQELNASPARCALLHILDQEELHTVDTTFVRLGWVVRRATTEDEAVRAASGDPELIVTDQLGTLRAVRQQADKEGRCVYFISDGKSDELFAAYREGADMVLSKPFNPGDLIGFL